MVFILRVANSLLFHARRNAGRVFRSVVMMIENVGPEADKAQPSGSAACVQAAGAKQEPIKVRNTHFGYVGSLEPEINSGRFVASSVLCYRSWTLFRTARC
jgi:hypothetical protein